MAERAPETRPRVFSIDPYVEAGGNYGAHMVINEEVAAQIFKAADFSRDVYVGKRVSERTVPMEVGSNTLTLKNLELPKLVSRSVSVEVKKSPDAFYINVDDQQIAKDVEEETKTYRNQDGENGRKVQSRQFVARFNREVASGLKTALATERADFDSHKLDYISLAAIVASWSELIVKGDSTFVPWTFPLGGYLAFKAFRQTRGHLQTLRLRPDLLPTFSREPGLSPVRYVRAYRQILRNQGKIIVERSDELGQKE